MNYPQPHIGTWRREYKRIIRRGRYESGSVWSLTVKGVTPARLSGWVKTKPEGRSYTGTVTDADQIVHVCESTSRDEAMRLVAEEVARRAKDIEAPLTPAQIADFEQRGLPIYRIFAQIGGKFGPVVPVAAYQSKIARDAALRVRMKP